MASITIDVMDPVVYESSTGRLVVYQELPGLHRDKHTCIIVEMKDAEALAKQILTVAMQSRERPDWREGWGLLMASYEMKSIRRAT